MAAPKTSQANAEHEQIVTQALAIVKMACGDCHPINVLAWERQALHLALRRSYDRSDIRNRGTRANGDTLYAVRSDSQPGKPYLVTVHPLAHPDCTCMAGVNGRPCKHSGLAIGVWAEERDRAWRAAEASECGEYNHLSREDRREMAAIAIRFHEGREGRW